MVLMSVGPTAQHLLQQLPGLSVQMEKPRLETVKDEARQSDSEPELGTT